MATDAEWSLACARSSEKFKTKSKCIRTTINNSFWNIKIRYFIILLSLRLNTQREAFILNKASFYLIPVQTSTPDSLPFVFI